MLTHLLVGYGYCASFLAKELIANHQSCLAISRHAPQIELPGLKHISCDLKEDLPSLPNSYILYYFIPPSESNQDSLLASVLNRLNPKPQKIIYIGSSGIYGDHQGQWVDEASECIIQTPRQQARLHAEQLLDTYSSTHQIACAKLRVAGIYGPSRIPIDAAHQQLPIIKANQAPLINHIYVNDLSRILCLLGSQITYHGVLNIADGHPTPMGHMQQLIAELLHLPQAPELDFDLIWQQASAMKREFMSQNKKLSIQGLTQVLRGSTIQITPIMEALTQLVEKS